VRWELERTLTAVEVSIRTSGRIREGMRPRRGQGRTVEFAGSSQVLGLVDDAVGS
jgi:hypothetical protein